ncbi:MAG: hypothetical protein HKN72_02460 [Gemmatimonadetes bacterium]|nr:hypothetical protein [Gemmatimonadota bacterium]
MLSTSIRLLTVAALAIAIAACDSSTGPSEGGEVEIRFRSTTTAAAVPGLLAVPVAGTNGILELTDLRMVIAELEFEALDGTCPSNSSDDDDDDCEEIELPPRLVEVPLDGSPLAVTTADLPAGAYDEFELEVEDLEDDEGDPGYAQAIATLRSTIAASFPDWPEEASVRVEGSFTPTGGQARPFVVYIDAEVEVELDLSPPLQVREGVTAGLDVVLSPERWFVLEDGSVLDLSAFDFPTTGVLLELEVEIEDGFEVEIDDD